MLAVCCVIFFPSPLRCIALRYLVTSLRLFFTSKFLGQFSRHWVGVSVVHHQPLWQASKQKRKKKKKIFGSKGGGGVTPLTPPKKNQKPFFWTQGGGGGLNTPNTPLPPQFSTHCVGVSVVHHQPLCKQATNKKRILRIQGGWTPLTHPPPPPRIRRDANCSFFAVFSTFFKLQMLVILSKMPQNTFFSRITLCTLLWKQMKNTVFQAKILFSFVRGWHLCIRAWHHDLSFSVLSWLTIM